MPSKGGTAAAKTDVARAAASNPVENRSAHMNANREVGGMVAKPVVTVLDINPRQVKVTVKIKRQA